MEEMVVVEISRAANKQKAPH